jgi:hypothetical protein
MIGSVLIKERLITPVQLDQALARQHELKARGQVAAIGQVLIEMGAVDENQIRIALRIQQEIAVLRCESDKLGIQLLEANVINPTQLQVALADHRATGMRLGEALVARGYINEQQLEHFLRLQVKRKMMMEAQERRAKKQ